ncbi:hypothetical protein ACWDE9_25995, partial [Streptomyces olivaceoviridis]
MFSQTSSSGSPHSAARLAHPHVIHVNDWFKFQSSAISGGDHVIISARNLIIGHTGASPCMGSQEENHHCLRCSSRSGIRKKFFRLSEEDSEAVMRTPQVVVVMGVAGTGKTTIGPLL